MKNLLRTRGRRLAMMVVLTPLLLALGACGRKDGDSGGPEGPKFGSSFSLPEVDVSEWPDGLRERRRQIIDAIEKFPEDPDQIGTLGAIYYVHGASDAALACFERARELAPDGAQWWYLAGLARERAGKPEEAKKAYERMLELDSNYSACYERLARLLVDSDVKRAAELCNRALELSPDLPTAMFTLGLCKEAEGDKASALAHFEQALEIAPQYKEANEAAARILSDMGREAEAELYRAAAEKGKEIVAGDPLYEALLRKGLNADIILRDALLLADRGRFERAHDMLKLLSDVGASSTIVLTATGIVHASEGKLEEAKKDFQLVLEAKPDVADVKARLADVQARLGQFEEAEAGFKDVLKEKPDDPFALQCYSRLLLTQERGEEAEALLDAALERQPGQQWIRVVLGNLLLDMNKDDEAREQFEACLEAEPDNPAARYSLGLLAQRAGDLDAAKKEWEQVLEKHPDYLQARVAMVEAAFGEHDFATAEAQLREGLKYTPDVPGLANSLAWVLATSPDDDQRNGEEAVLLAESACEATERGQHEYLDTLAAAYAEAGRFDEAVQTERDAIKLAQDAKQEATVANYQKRLELYEQKKPYRDEG